MAKKNSFNIMDVEYPSISKTFQDLNKVEEKETSASHVRFIMDADDRAAEAEAKAQEAEPTTLFKSITNMLDGGKNSITRLAFEKDPSLNSTYGSLYEMKLRLLPDLLLKRIAIQDDLVASIVLARSNQVGSYGRPRPDRHSTGFVVEPNPGVVDRFTPEEKQLLDERIEKAVKLLASCGNTKGWSDEDRCSFTTWLHMSARNAVVCGRLATEIIYVDDLAGGKKFHSFRALDAGTIYRAAPQKEAADAVRKQALRLLEQIKNKKLIPEKYQTDQYSWVQVLDGRPVQAFTAEECVVHNFYPVPDVELNGYPVTPIDTMINAVTTHINITNHNKIYFQTGRATRGMLVIRSDEVDENVIARVKQQFNASINSVQNAWRMPVFAVGQQDEITWSSIDSGGRDMEFQYLTDMNARVIFSAFQMSPEEVSGWSYLSRGTNNQALSESNNEYKLEAARDVGIRPLLQDFETFINDVLFPLIDPFLARCCRVKLMGMDADTPEKESTRLAQDLSLHMTMDQVLQKVEKKPLGKKWGGELLLNPQYHEILDQHFTVGEIEEYFMDRVGASKDPQLAYRRDPFFFQWIQLQQQMQQAQQQAQMQQAQAGQGPAPGAEQGESAGVSDEGSPGGNAPAMDAETDKQKSDKAKDALGQDTSKPDVNTGSTGEDLTRSIDQAIGVLTKSEAQLPPSKRRILAQHKAVLKQAMDGWAEEQRLATQAILDIAEHHKPTPKKKG